MNKWENPKIESIELKETNDVCTNHVLLNTLEIDPEGRATYSCSCGEVTGSMQDVLDHIAKVHEEGACVDKIS